jgi:hypothetical protein
MKRIPFRWLNNEAIYNKIIGKNKYQEPQYDSPVPLGHVRVEYNVRTYNKANGEVIMDDAVVFFDPVQSTPGDVKFVELSQIIVNNIKFNLRKIDILNDETGTLHHYELRLVGNK